MIFHLKELHELVFIKLLFKKNLAQYPSPREEIFLGVPDQGKVSLLVPQ